MQPIGPYNPRDKYPVSRLAVSNRLNFGKEIKMLASKYDAEGNYIYLGSEDGVLRLLSTATNNSVMFSMTATCGKPITCLALNNKSKQLKNTAMATYTDGTIIYWHCTSKQILSQKKYESMLNCCGFSCNGTTYSFAGEDFKIHIGNLGKNNVFDLKQGRLGEHSNRVYCTKWHDQDPNLMFSGGWDETLYFWDIRMQEAVHKIYKVSVSGQGLDVKDNILLIGNQDYENRLRLYDLRTQKTQNVEWVDYGNERSMVCSCGFDRNRNILAGSLKSNELRLFENNKCVDVFNQIEKHIYSVAVSPVKNECVVTYGEGQVAVFTY